MLQAIRDKVTGWIAYGIIFLISVPFALWGVNSYLGGGEAPPVAVVNGEEITQAVLDREYADYRQRLSQLFGGSIPESFGTELMLRQQVLGQLIEEVALRQYTQNQRYRIGDAALNRIIRARKDFQIEGRFDSEIYQAQLRSLGYSPLGFEQQLRHNGSIEQFQNGIVATAFTTSVLEKQFTSLNNQSRKIRTLTYELDPDTIQIDASQIEQHYQANADRYRTPEKVKIDFIELSLDHFKRGIEVEEDDVFARYQDNKSSYSSAEIREASHILVKLADDENSDSALVRINQIRDRIVNGESFSALARELSEDPGSVADGGNLGEIERGFMVPAFEAALYAMQVDQLSEPLKTTFGWHLIKLHSISGGETQSFDSLKAGIEDEIRSELAENQIYDLAENLANLVYEQPDSLLSAAEQLDLPVQTSDWFERANGTGIAAEQKIRQAAFSPDVLQQGLNSETLELGSDRVVVIRLNQREPAARRQLEQVREIVKAELVREIMREQSLKVGDQALADLKSGKGLADLALEWSATVDNPGFVERGQIAIGSAILNRAFSMAKPDPGLVFDGFALAGGGYSIIELSAVLVNDGDVDQKAIEELEQAQGGSEYQSVLKLLTSRADVNRTGIEDL